MNKVKILIVDDLPDNTFLLSGLLSENGYEPLIARSGEECFEILSQDTPELILMDIMMPVMTGIEALEKIQENQALRQIPVIMVSAKTDSKDVEEALNKGAVDYIKKPINEIELLARVKSILRLKESEDRMREMINAQKDFIRLISHDLRSPFTTIHGFAEMIQDDENLTEDQKSALHFIVESINQSTQYFNKLLDWTKMGGSEIEISKKEFPISKLLDHSKALFNNKAKEKEIELSVSLDKDFNLMADDVYLLQVINNLVNNAIKFTPNNGKVTLKAELTEKSKKIIISDTGIGMPADITPETLFSKSINKSRKGTNGEKGTGIGLSICKKIIEAHGFNITFRSEPQKFTEFTILCLN